MEKQGHRWEICVGLEAEDFYKTDGIMWGDQDGKAGLYLPLRMFLDPPRGRSEMEREDKKNRGQVKERD